MKRIVRYLLLGFGFAYLFTLPLATGVLAVLYAVPATVMAYDKQMMSKKYISRKRQFSAIGFSGF